MKLIILFFALFFFLFSCSDEDLIIETEEPIINKFEFKGIEYFKDGDYEEIVELALDTTVVRNNTTMPIKLIDYPFTNFSNVSFFKSDDDKMLDFIDEDSLYVKIPHFINDKSISLGSEMWLFSNQFVLHRPNNEMSDTTVVEPFTKASVVMYVIQRKCFTRFELTYLNKVTNKDEVIQGKWEGTYLDGYRKEVFTQKMKP